MLMSPGVSCLHQELALLVAVPLGVLARGVAVHIVVLVPTLHSWHVLDVMMSMLVSTHFHLTLRQARSRLCMWEREQEDHSVSPSN